MHNQSMEKTPRFIVQDRRNRESGYVRKIREPWEIIDTTTNRIVDELKTAKAARIWAKHLNEQQRSVSPKEQRP